MSDWREPPAMAWLLRLELPDVPGSLGRVAGAIGEAGGDIEAIEIVEHRPDDGTAVDDVLLELAPGTMPDSIVSACNMLDGVHVIWISRYAAGGHLFLDLEAVEQMTTDPLAALDALVELLPATFRADWGMRVRRHDDGRLELVHRTSAAPDLPDDVEWPHVARPANIAVPEQWQPLVVAAAPLGDEDTVVIGRRGGPAILDSELARLGHLAALAISITRSAETA